MKAHSFGYLPRTTNSNLSSPPFFFFLFNDHSKTVIITGSQVPITEIRNDAIDNLLGALTIAGHFVIPEVSLYFGNKLFRGNRSSKMDAIDFNAFDSPNLPPLVKVGINIGKED